MGSDVSLATPKNAKLVSIHAPAWGATREAKEALHPGAVSIHAPAWGATLSGMAPPVRSEFQFTLPHGERPADLSFLSEHSSFNSRSRMGSDTPPGYGDRLCPRFNSRSRMGSDRVIPGTDNHQISFNSRSRMGSDRVEIEAHAAIGVSIHAPAWGATGRSVVIFGAVWVSIHAPAWGATCVCWYGWRRTGVSIHAPAWGATFSPVVSSIRQMVSIHAPAWGATPPTRRGAWSSLFQFTLPHGERLGRV